LWVNLFFQRYACRRGNSRCTTGVRIPVASLEETAANPPASGANPSLTSICPWDLPCHARVGGCSNVLGGSEIWALAFPCPQGSRLAPLGLVTFPGTRADQFSHPRWDPDSLPKDWREQVTVGAFRFCASLGSDGRLRAVPDGPSSCRSWTIENPERFCLGLREKDVLFNLSLLPTEQHSPFEHYAKIRLRPFIDN